MKKIGIALFALVLQAGAQQPNPGTIQGIVAAAEGGTPLSNATVDLMGPSGNSPLYSTRSNADGRFLLPNVAPGTYRLSAMRPGYVRTEFEQRIPGGPSSNLVIAAGQRIADIRLALIRGSVVSGRVTDKGQPVGIADIVAMKPVYIDGQFTMVTVLND